MTMIIEDVQAEDQDLDHALDHVEVVDTDEDHEATAVPDRIRLKKRTEMAIHKRPIMSRGVRREAVAVHDQETADDAATDHVPTIAIVATVAVEADRLADAIAALDRDHTERAIQYRLVVRTIPSEMKKKKSLTMEMT